MFLCVASNIRKLVAQVTEEKLKSRPMYQNLREAIKNPSKLPGYIKTYSEGILKLTNPKDIATYEDLYKKEINSTEKQTLRNLIASLKKINSAFVALNNASKMGAKPEALLSTAENLSAAFEDWAFNLSKTKDLPVSIPTLQEISA